MERMLALQRNLGDPAWNATARGLEELKRKNDQ
jgi:hypothetical protein